MVFFHGTDIDSAIQILRHGFNDEDRSMVWNCSDPDNVYMWAATGEDTAISGTVETDEGFYLASESGLTGAAIKGCNKPGIVVFAIDLDETQVEEDDSCPNMYGAYQISAQKLNTAVSNGVAHFRMFLYGDAYKPDFRWFYLLSLNMELVEGLSEKELNNIEFARKISEGAECSAFETLYDWYDAREVYSLE